MSISCPEPPRHPDRPLPADGFGRALVAVDTGLDDLADAPVWALDDARLQDRLTGAFAARARLDEAIARLVAQVHQRDLATTAGASSTRAHLVAGWLLSTGAAAGLVRQATAMGERTELTRDAWAAGLISADQAVVIGAAVDKLSADVDPDTVQAAQADLIAHAQTLTHTQLQVVANHLVQVVDPETADQVLAEQLEAEEARALAHTTFKGRKGADGIARFSAKVPNLAFDMLTCALEALASPRRTRHDADGGHDGEAVTVAAAVTSPAGTQPAQQRSPTDTSPPWPWRPPCAGSSSVPCPRLSRPTTQPRGAPPLRGHFLIGQRIGFEGIFDESTRRATIRLLSVYSRFQAGPPTARDVDLYAGMGSGGSSL